MKIKSTTATHSSLGLGDLLEAGSLLLLGLRAVLVQQLEEGQRVVLVQGLVELRNQQKVSGKAVGNETSRQQQQQHRTYNTTTKYQQNNNNKNNNNNRTRDKRDKTSTLPAPG